MVCLLHPIIYCYSHILPLFHFYGHHWRCISRCVKYLENPAGYFKTVSFDMHYLNLFSCYCIYFKLVTTIDAMSKWKPFGDGGHCFSLNGGKLLSRNITSGDECMALANDRFRYVSFMIQTNTHGRWCFGYESCGSLVSHSNYKTYERRSSRGEFYDLYLE